MNIVTEAFCGIEIIAARIAMTFAQYEKGHKEAVNVKVKKFLFEQNQMTFYIMGDLNQ